MYPKNNFDLKGVDLFIFGEHAGEICEFKSPLGVKSAMGDRCRLRRKLPLERIVKIVGIPSNAALKTPSTLH